MADRWSIRYPGGDHEEIGIEPHNCGDPWDCYCIKNPDHDHCGLTTKEAQFEVVEYYENRADYLRALPAIQFLRNMGYHEPAHVCVADEER